MRIGCLRLGRFLLVAAICVGLTVTVRAQEAHVAVIAVMDLPESPGALLNVRETDLFGQDAETPDNRTKPAKRYHRVVHADEVAEPLSGVDKLKLSVLSRLTFTEVASTALSAGISQARDSKPHYGTDSGAFGERLGALALKQTTQSIFSYGIYAAAFHDDPRYYVMGREHGIGRRALYSATRLVVAKKDDGSAAVNWPKLAGIVTATALTNAYYPEEDHGFKNLAQGSATSLYTSILNNEIHEFIGDAFRLIRHKH